MVTSIKSTRKNITTSPKVPIYDGALLSDRDIKRLIEKGDLKIEPFDSEQIRQAGVDLTLSDEWFFIKEDLKEPVDLNDFAIHKHTNSVRAQKVVLEPGKMCLALTRERVHMPNNLIGIMEGRSRFARAGLTVHITSNIIQPGSKNRQILEMVNLGPKALLITSGTRITHIFFLRMTSPTTRPYNDNSTLPII